MPGSAFALTSKSLPQASRYGCTCSLMHLQTASRSFTNSLDIQLTCLVGAKAGPIPQRQSASRPAPILILKSVASIRNKAFGTWNESSTSNCMRQSFQKAGSLHLEESRTIALCIQHRWTIRAEGTRQVGHASSIPPVAQ